MATLINQLSAATILAAPRGYHGDGFGLYLQVSANLTRSWVFRFSLNGRPREMGLGRVDARDAASAARSLKDARKAAADARQIVSQGIDPIDARKAVKAEAVTKRAHLVPFAVAAERLIASKADGWRSPRAVSTWRNTLRDYAMPVLGNVPVAAIDTALVLKVLEPIWHDKMETADRVRSRIEAVLDWAKAHDHRDGDNPARWRGHLDKILPSAKKRKVEHHAAMPRDELPAMLVKLRSQTDLAARALEFLILTAGRDSEITGARWSEIDFVTRTWTIPGERMKNGLSHVVPLSDRAVELLMQMLPRTGERIFPGVSRLGMRLVRLIGDAYTVHGFRSTFRDWAGDCTNHDRLLAEEALAHKVGSAVEQAYRRGTAIERRRVLMQDWAAFCNGDTATVIPLRAIA